MRSILDAGRMRKADEITINMLNNNGILLMEHAGTSCVRELKRVFGNELKNKRVICVAGKGNNGGDAIVVARQLVSMGVGVKLVLLAREGDYRGDAGFQLNIIRNYPVEIEVIDKERENGIEALKGILSDADIVVEGIFGTGLTRPVSGFYKDIIDTINNDFDGFVLSVDIPSGLFADKGLDNFTHVKADLTITFGNLKPCHVLYPACKSCGKVVEDWITIPEFVFKRVGSYFNLVEMDDIPALRKGFPEDAHKGTFGHAAIFSGERGKLGASILASYAALKSGCGLSTVYLSKNDYGLVSSIYPEIMFFLADKKDDEGFISEFLENKSAVLIGQGLGIGKSEKDFVKKVLKATDIPVVLDADVFKNFNLEELSDLIDGKDAVLTPHPGEMSSLTGYSVKEVQEDRIEVAREVAKKTGAAIVLKGYQTVVVYKGKVFVNSTGSNAMGTAGSGDVLGGVITSLLCQGYSLLDSVLLGVLCHGLAGEMAEKKIGREGVVAGDIINFISSALNYGL